MTGYIKYCSGERYELPQLISWRMSYGIGEPCDAFEVCCVYTEALAGKLKDACGFFGEHDGKRVFTGVIDEYEIAYTGTGATVSISGRSMAALLLDNETEAMTYESCGIEDILSNHVRPFGITDIETDSLPTIYGYSVSSGRSQWTALCGYADRAAKIMPRFSATGKLIISGKTGKKISIATGSYEAGYRRKRYGVISRVLVKNRVAGTELTVENRDFIKRGGNAGRVINVPRTASGGEMRYTGEYQIRKSQEESELYTLKLAKLFAAFPNDEVTVKISVPNISGKYTVTGSEVWADGNGAGTELKLKKLK